MAKRSSLTSIVSGQAEVVVETDALGSSYRRFGDTSYRVCLPGDITNLLSDAQDAIFVKSKSGEQAYQILKSEWMNDRSLQLMLILLDRDSHLRAKSIAAEWLEKFLAYEAVRDFLAHRLFSRSLPESSGIAEALRMSAADVRRTLWGFLSELQKYREQIAAVREQWELLDPDVFDGAEEKLRFEQFAVSEGVFFNLSTGHQHGFDAERWRNNPRLAQFVEWERILTAWSRPFVRKKPAKEIQRSLFEVRDADEG